jgi:hypothetical protein
VLLMLLVWLFDRLLGIEHDDDNDRLLPIGDL